MYRYSYGVSSEVLLTCCSNVMVSWICPYSCLLFRMYRAYADWGVIVYYISDVLLVSFEVAARLSDVRHVACVACEFVNAAFVVLWGCVVRPGFYELL
jgi:hypothetical protein